MTIREISHNKYQEISFGNQNIYFQYLNKYSVIRIQSNLNKALKRFITEVIL